MEKQSGKWVFISMRFKIPWVAVCCNKKKGASRWVFFGVPKMTSVYVIWPKCPDEMVGFWGFFNFSCVYQSTPTINYKTIFSKKKKKIIEQYIYIYITINYRNIYIYIKRERGNDLVIIFKKKLWEKKEVIDFFLLIFIISMKVILIFF